MRLPGLLILALAAPWLCRCSWNSRLNEVGRTRMIFEPPSLFGAETETGRRTAFKAEAARAYRNSYSATTDAFEEEDVDYRPAFPGNLRVAQGERSLLGSAAFRLSGGVDIFAQAEGATVAGTFASVWLAGLRTEAEPGGFSAFLEAGAGLIDVYIGSTLEMYQKERPPFLIFAGEREYLGSETIDGHRFVPFPHFAVGLKVRSGAGINLLAKARTLYLYDAFGVGADAFLNSAGAEAELAITGSLSVHASAGLQANTLADSELAESLGLGFTLRPW